MLIGAVDSWGMLPADSRTLESTLAPFTTHTGQVLTESVLVLTEIGLLRYWSHQGDPWIYLEGHETNQRLSKRKKNPDVPLPTKSGPLPARNGVLQGKKPYDVDFDSDLDNDVDAEGTTEQPPAASTSDPDPEPPRTRWTVYQIELQALAQCWADLAGSDPPSVKAIPSDVRARMVQAIERDPLLDTPRKAIAGRFIYDKEKKQDTPTLGSCFPYIDAAHRYHLADFYDKLAMKKEKRHNGR